MKKILIGAVGVLAWSSVANAQTCNGTMDTPMQVGGAAAFGSDHRDFAGGVNKQTDAFFARAGVALTKVSGVSAGTGFLVEGGKELHVKASKPVSVCPTVAILKLWGIDPGAGFNISPLAISFGATAGFEATKVNTTRVVPTFGFFLTRLTEHFDGGSFSEWTKALTLGVGLILSEKTAIVPTVNVPVGHDTGGIVFSILVSRKLR